jgi:hypothetical protein
MVIDPMASFNGADRGSGVQVEPDLPRKTRFTLFQTML